MPQVFVGRQPIFDANLNLFAYELLFRQGNHQQAGVIDGDQATAQVLVNTFLEFGLEQLVGNHLAFVNFTRSILLSDELPPFPPDRLGIEILENEVLDEDLVNAVEKLSQKGFTLALDDFVYDPIWEPLIAAVSLVKIDVRSLTPSAVQEQVHIMRRRGKQILAEKVETREEFETYKAMGFDYFQGYFLSRPEVISRETVPVNRLNTLQLLAAFQNPDIGVDDIEELVRRDVSLSFKLLRYINSAFFALTEKVSSVRQAVVYLGLGPVKRLTSMLIVSEINDQPQELMRVALVRGNMCERLCQKAVGAEPDSYFIVGLFSVLDALLNLPLSRILEQLPLSEKVTIAILKQEGLMGDALRCTLAYEECDWAKVEFAEFSEEALSENYAESIRWSWAMSSLLSVTV